MESLFTRVLTKTLSLFKVGMLGCVAMDVVPPYWMALGESALGVWPWASLVGWALWHGWLLRNGPGRSW
jgi:hypothetical protein